ncbi:MAG: hypothetical protein IH845_03215 [Nanoarchaeota archaeon]|nr:hypothetical protein [Nanoarchaeota archaeon]
MNSTITFSWNNSIDIDGDTITYDLEIYNESDMAAANLVHSNTSIAEGTDPTSINITLSDYTTTDDDYYWRVRANDSVLASDWSVTRQFQYANWTITFNLTDSFGGLQIDTSGQKSFDVSCDNGFSDANVENPYTSIPADSFAAGTWECTFSDLIGYFDKTQNIVADSDKTIEISMQAEDSLTPEEHGWLEELYDCVINGNCDAYDLWNNTWKRISRTDTGVITQETFISNTLNSTSNITLNYTIDIPFKAGYASGELLPLRMFFWFTDVNKTQCYNQDKGTGTNRAESPYCLPLVAETLGPNNGTVTFTVDLRPSLADGNYNITRSIEIDPIVDGEVTWTNYGQENIGQVKVEEQNDDPSINLNKLGEIFPSTAGITGAVLGIGSNILSGNQLVLMFTMLCITLIVVVFNRSKTKLKLVGH